MGTVAENLLDAVDILVDGKLSKLQYNKTIRGRISEVIDESIGQYKIQYQNSYFTAYTSDSNAKYQKGSEVYVEILSGDFEKNALILGTVQRLGSNYISIIERLDRYVNAGTNIGSGQSSVNFCSYNGEQNHTVWEDDAVISQLAVYTDLAQDITVRNIARDNIIETIVDGEKVYSDYTINKQDVVEYAAAADTIKVSMDIRTALNSEQRTGSGNYGLRIYTLYYDEGYKDHNDSELLNRVYTFDVNDMIGQPYRYISTTNQYGLYPVDGKNFLGIYKIEAFCENFPYIKDEQPEDIFLSNVELQFLKQLSEEELNTTSLNIITPYGNYFSKPSEESSENQTLTLRADLRIRGKKVNYDVQDIDFYWFRKNAAIKTGHEKFSVYGGNGWECLNKIKKAPDGEALSYTEFVPGGKDLEITSDLCPSEETEFKCVAVYKDGNAFVSLTAKTVIKNYIDKIKLEIVSDTGTLFSFNIGKTTLHMLVDGEESDEYIYYWSQSIQGGAAQLIDDNHFNSLEVEIATPAASFITYDCSIFNEDGFKGSSSITLLNNKENLGSTLIINNGAQIFKYDGYGVAPTSNSLAESDRMVIPALSFDIYDKEGKVINIPDNEKPRKMSIRWIWPVTYLQDTTSTDEYKLKKTATTMLTTDEDMRTIEVADIANGNKSKSITVLENKATFTYGIENTYNASLANTEAARNNIILEVDYQGEHLVASTNFTFTKEGELGTNGTKYIARVIPASPYKELFIRNNKLCGYQLDSSTGGFRITEITTASNPTVELYQILRPQLWNGGIEETEIDFNKITWNIASSSTRANKNTRLTIYKENDIIYAKVNSGEELNDRIIIQATIPYGDLKYYATYSIPVIQDNDDKIFWLIGGYSEVMYESDGSRGKFNGLPFEPVFLTTAGYENINQILSDEQLQWNIKWGGQPKPVPNTINRFTIEPPSYYIAEDSNQYIEVTLELNGKNYSILKPIELYLNRYGMSAMNDWDGSSIQISEDGGYILSPQVGAGRKENDNSFTGITIGEVFQDQNNKEIGMFGYYQGQRSLFLDAETGDAEFGVASEGQIKIRASDGQGTISDGHYNYNHEKPYDPAHPDEPNAGRGLKIKFTSTPKDQSDPNDEQGPYIKYGSGNFIVDAQGHLVAQGGGSIAGWNITDTYLQSQDKKATLYSGDTTATMVLDSNDTAIAYNNIHWNDSRQKRFDIGGKFQVNEDGALKSIAGKIGGWFIQNNKLFARNNSIETLALNDNGSIFGPEETSIFQHYYYLGTVPEAPVGENDSRTLPITLDNSQNQLIDKYITYQTEESQIYRMVWEDDVGTLEQLDEEEDSEIIENAKYGGIFHSLVLDNNGYINNFEPINNIYVKYSNNRYYLYKDNKWATKSSAPGRTYLFLGTVNSTISTTQKLINVKLNNNIYGDFLNNIITYYQYQNNVWVIINDIYNKQQIGILTQPLENNFSNLTFTTLEPIPNNGYVSYTNNGHSDYYYKNINNIWMKLNNFSPNNRVWEITPKGVAYFTDVKIRNSPNKTGGDTIGANSFQWRGVETAADGSLNYPVIFELTDTGSNIGGWNITNDKLKSGNVEIISSNANSSLPVISIGEALQIYGNGSINSGGGANFKGSGSIGGCTFGGGTFNCPGGVLYFDGKQVGLSTIKYVSDVSITISKKNPTTQTKQLTMQATAGEDSVVFSKSEFSYTNFSLELEYIISYKSYDVMQTLDGGSSSGTPESRTLTNFVSL